jgi:hypothetical protein
MSYPDRHELWQGDHFDERASPTERHSVGNDDNILRTYPSVLHLLSLSWWERTKSEYLPEIGKRSFIYFARDIVRTEYIPCVIIGWPPASVFVLQVSYYTHKW